MTRNSFDDLSRDQALCRWNKRIQSDGFAVMDCIPEDLLTVCKNAVLSQMSTESPKAFACWDEMLKDYCAAPEVHASLKAKVKRTLPLHVVNGLLSAGLHELLSLFSSEYLITDEENYGFPNIYFRVVRPSSPSDIGTLHADSWFWKINNWHIPYNYERTKLWFPLSIESGLSGLRMVPLSHKHPVPYRSKTDLEGKSRPVIDQFDESKALLLDTPLGSAVFFHDNVIHGGALNLGRSLRISIEMTILTPVS